MKNNRPTYKKIPKDQDTISSAGKEVRLGVYQAIHQYFRWEGIDGESLIFETKGLSLNHQELEELVEASNFYDGERDSGITISADESFTFVNFNFVLKED
jgi:hypothetical protein